VQARCSTMDNIAPVQGAPATGTPKIASIVQSPLRAHVTDVEILTRNVRSVAIFYGHLLGVRCDILIDGSCKLQAESARRDGGVSILVRAGSDSDQRLNVFEVASIDDCGRRAVEVGAQLIGRALDRNGVPIAFFRDAEGNAFGLTQGNPDARKKR
jgi:predicted enzyme related to lactoylglutathione lyase